LPKQFAGSRARRGRPWPAPSAEQVTDASQKHVAALASHLLAYFPGISDAGGGKAELFMEAQATVRASDMTRIMSLIAK
jgi:hypothetical protein